MKSILFRSLTFTYFFLICAGAIAQPPEGNDEPCTAVPFPTGGLCGEDILISTVGATTSAVAFPPSNTCNPGLVNADLAYNDIWYTTTADANGDIFIEAIVGPDDPVVAVYTSSNNLCTGTFTLQGCDDDGGPGLDANLNITTLAPNQPVWIRVWSFAYGATPDVGTFIIAATNGGTPPANDLCGSATGVTAGPTYAGTTICATVSGGDPSGGSCAIATDNNVWYSFTPGTSGGYAVNFSNLSCIGINNDLQVSIFTGSCGGPYTQVACNASVGSATTFTGIAGTTYYIMVDGLNGASCDFDLTITTGCAFSNQNCATAETVPGLTGVNTQVCVLNECNNGVPTPSINTAASDCGDIAGPVLWYTFTTDAGDELLDVVASSSDFDPHIMIWSNCGTYLADQEYCDVSNPGAGSASILQAGITGSTTYYISVSPSAGIGTGDFDLCVTSYPNPCSPSDICAAAAPFGTPASTVQSCLVNECNIGADDLTTGTPSCGTIQGEITYYTLTMGAGDDLVDIEVTSATILDPMIVIWDACGTYFVNECAVGSGGSVSYTYDPGIPGATVLFSVTSASGNYTGFYDVCVTPYPNNAACNIDNDLYINVAGSDPTDANGNYLPGSTIEFCYDINQYNQTNLNFLHGVVPTFGNAYNPASITPSYTPPPSANNEVGSYWGWTAANTVQYNNFVGGKYPPLYTIPDAGWWFYSVNSAGGLPADPDNSWGDGCNTQIVAAPNAATCVIGIGGVWLGGGACLLGCVGNPATGMGMTWQFCFELTTQTVYDCNTPMDFSVSVETFADGETGSWTDPGCSVDGPTTLVVPAPTPAPIFISLVSSTNPSCNGYSDGQIVVSATGGYTAAGNPLLYSINGGAYSATTTFNGLPAGNHTISVIDAIGCVQTLVVPLTDPAIPLPPTIGYNNPICVGEPINLTATVGAGITATNYSWTGPNAFTSTLQNPTIASATLANSGTYNLTSDINGCPSSMASVTITIQPNPTASISPDPLTMCQNATPTVNGNPAGGSGSYITHAWTGTGAAYLSSTSVASPTFNGTTAGSYTLAYTVTDDYGCSGTDNVNVTVHPTPTVNAVGDQTLCNNAATTAVNFTGAVAGTTYNWTNTNTAIGLGASGTGNIASFTATNPGAAPISGTITVTPTANGCPGTPTNFTITVNPTPTVTAVGNQSVCHNAATTAVNFTGAVAGTTYNWTNTNTAIGLGASGTGNIASFTATNPGAAPISGTITVTPTANGCPGTPTNFTITVNPTPTVSAVGNQSVCHNAATTAVIFTGAVAGTTYNWTNTNTAIGLGASGTGNIASFTATNPGAAPISGTITVTPTANGCPGTPTNFTITVNPTPTVTAIGNQTLCHNAATTAVNFTGAVAGTTYNWTNTNTAIGLGASGTGNIASFTATNPGAAPISGTITVTPTANGCPGTPTNFTITVNPTPTLTAVGNQSVCHNAATTAVNFTGAVAGTTYNWTNTNTAIGLGASGTGNIASFTATNPGAAPISGTITVTPTANGCPGTPTNFTITVNPTPTVTAVGNQTLCHNAATTAVNFTGAVAGTTYNWTNTNTAIGLGASGTGNIASFTATNPGAAPISGTITVTPTANGCPGTPTNFTITVNPTPVFAVTPADLTVCGFSDGTLTLTGLIPAGSYDVGYLDGAIPVVLPGQIADGSGNIIITGLGAGTYTTISVFDGNCTFQVAGPFVLTDPASPTFTVSGSDPTTCGGNDGSITLTGLTASTIYDVEFNDGGLVLLPGVTTDASGNYVITGLDAGSYSGFVVSLAGCSGNQAGPIVLSDPGSPAAPVAGIDAAYCDGDVIADLTATAGSGGTLTWYNDVALTNIVGSGTTHTPASTIGTTTYYATESVAGCESAPTAVTVTINPTPVAPVAGTDATYCDGDPLTDLTAATSLGGTLNWYDDAGLTNNVGTGTSVAPSGALGTTTYYITETVLGCESLPSTVDITVNPVATFAIGTTSDPTGCGFTDGFITLTGLNASSNYEVSYDDGSGTVNLGTITTDAAGEYVITGLGADNYDNFVVTLGACPATVAGPVALSDPGSPTFTVSGSDPSTCGGNDGSITITGLIASTIYDVEFNDGGLVLLPGVTTDASGNYVITGLDAGSYSGFVVSLAGCSGNQAGPIVLSGPGSPAAPVAGIDAAYCDGDVIADLTATAGSGGTLTWYNDVALTNIVGTGAILSPASTLGTIVYYATESVAGCESAPTAVTVTINPTPVAPVAGTDATYCDGDPLTDLTAATSLGGTLNWYDDAGLTNLLASGVTTLTPLSSIGVTTYYITETLGSCASAASMVTVTINPAPSGSIGGSTDPTACGASDGTITITALTALTNYDISYDDGTGTVSLGTVSTDAAGDYVISGLSADNFTNITVTLGTCSIVLGPVTLTDPGAPTFAIAFADPTTCGGSDGTITLSGLTVSTTYDVSYDDGTGTVNLGTITSDASGNYVITGLPAGSYTNFVVTLAGCTSTDASIVTLTDPGAPAAPVAGTNASYCLGDIIADLTATAGSAGTLTWYDDAALTNVVGTGATFTPSGTLGTTTYYVTETATGCESASTAVTVTVNAIPAAPTAGTDASYCVGDVLASMTASGTGGTLTWYSDAALTTTLGTGGALTPSASIGVTTYYVAETVGICESPAAMVTITVTDCDTTQLEIPTGFTPGDGDGINETWEILGLTPKYPDAIVKVYNRWGNILFESSPGYPTPWDGTYNNEPLPVASYYFIIEFNDDATEPVTGSVTIIRN